MAFPEKLKALRLENGLTQDELGEKLYLSRASISSYESSCIDCTKHWLESEVEE
jgi:DNA-binding XRE family transcriptional regulator